MTDAMDDAITICVPAKAEHIAVFRAAVGVVASRLEFSLDDIDDLRILVDEAASVLMSSGASQSLTCEIATVDDSVHFKLRARLPEGQQPHGEGFAWNILNALAHEVSTQLEAGEHVISVSRHRGPVLDSAF